VDAHSGFCAQTVVVPAALRDHPSEWRPGYALAPQTGLASGPLYRILIRLADQGLVESCWPNEPQPGRSHRYRLTADGLAAAVPGPAEVGVRAGQRPALSWRGLVTRAAP
jgi:PadR family transcriptional regulator, regulatory protein PadR